MHRSGASSSLGQQSGSTSFILVLLMALFLSTLLPAPGHAFTWEPRTNPAPQDLYGVHFVSPYLGTAVGDAGTILRTTDGGLSWTQQTSPVSEFLKSVSFISPTVGVIVGSSGTILRTEDGGATWNPVASPTTVSLFTVIFVDDQVGYAVGGIGTMVKTTDGGESWTAVATGTAVNLKGVSFTDPMTGTVTGFGVVQRTTDGGATWTPQTTPLTGVVSMDDIEFLTPSTAVTVASTLGIGSFAGDILRTTDAGETWTVVPIPIGSGLTRVDFIDPLVGFACGLGGRVLATTDGGLTWTEEASGVTTNLLDINATSSTRACAVGLAAVLLTRSDPADNVWIYDGGASYVENWNFDLNWDRDVVPDATSHAVIPFALPFVAVTGPTDITRSLEITPTGRLVVKGADNGKTLTILEDLVNFGTINTAGTPRDNGPVIKVGGTVANHGLFDLRDIGRTRPGLVLTGTDQVLTGSERIILQNLTVSGPFTVDGITVYVTGQYFAPAGLTPTLANGGRFVLGPVTETLTMDFAEGWSLVSVPVVVPDFSPAVLFPTALPGQCFGYTGSGYETASQLAVGEAYWVLHGAPGATTMEGEPVHEWSFDASEAGWWLIGSVTEHASLDRLQSVPADRIVPGQVFEYVGGDYIAATSLQPGRGYWVLVNEACALNVVP